MVDIKEYLTSLGLTMARNQRRRIEGLLFYCIYLHGKSCDDGSFHQLWHVISTFRYQHAEFNDSDLTLLV